MTLRVVAAVLLAVALLAVATPGIQTARERATVDAVRGDAETVAAAVDALEGAERGSRRVVSFEVPGASAGTVAVACVAMSTSAIRYRLETGRRGGLALPATVTVRAGERLALQGTGTHRVVLTATESGVVVSRDPPRADGRTAVSADEHLSNGTRPEPACSMGPTTARARRVARVGSSGSTRTAVRARATSRRVRTVARRW